MHRQLTGEEYAFVTHNMPIVCVDMIPVRQQGGLLQIGSIVRAAGSQKGKIALIGGRVTYGEKLEAAIARHLEHDLGVRSFSFWPGNSVAQPFHVQQYEHADSSTPPFGFDPTKHSIGLTYLVDLHDEPQAANEALSFQWLDLDALPEKGAFNQHLVLKAACAFLNLP
jgi:ADP-ribose pyrophosphatase YjhB (NUDIX family)